MRDADELARIERFAHSIRHADSSSVAPSMFQRLAQLLCEAARLYVESRAASTVLPPSVLHGEFNGFLTMFGFAAPASGSAGDAAVDDAAGGVSERDGQEEDLDWDNLQGQPHGPDDWYQSNEDMTGLLDEDIFY